MAEKYAAKEQEALIKKFWQDNNTFAFDKNSSKPIFSIDTPPPTISGALHIGHVFSYLHTDLIARYKRIAGFNVYYPMGFDDNGLPTERFVEKKLKIRSKALKRSEFTALCQKECAIAEEDFKQLWQAIGLSVDWKYCYSTISTLVQGVSQKNFLQMLKKGLVYRKKEPSLFCTDFQTTVAQAELTSIQKDTFMNTLAFTLEEDGSILPIATTRPELLSACVCIFVNPIDIRYRELIGKKAKVPLYGQIVEIMADEGVIPEKGTGVVMCCTFGGQQDVTWFRIHKFSHVIEAIGLDGKMTANAGFLKGLTVTEAREAAIVALKEAGLLLEQKAITHDVEIYERSKREIEYFMFSQWFVKIVEFKNHFLKIGKELNWYPSSMKARYDDWVANLTWDWCISRQRHVGISFPVWHCRDCSQILTVAEDMLPIDPSDTPYPNGKCDYCGSLNIIPDLDVMDTWATSSSTPQINAAMLGISTKEFFPMSMRPQAHDIIRTWAFYTMAKSSHLEARLPWKDIAISGHVLTSGKEKISKSSGNSQLTPQSLLENFPADAIRFWAAKGKLGIDTVFSEEQLKNGHRLVIKFWNAVRFAKDNFIAAKKRDSAFDWNQQPQNLDLLSKWVLAHLEQTSTNYHKCFLEYDYSQALDVIDAFFWNIFCDNYIELVKDQIFHPENYPTEIVNCYSYTLYQVVLEVAKMYAPFIPFVTETIYQEVFAAIEKSPSIHQTTFKINELQTFRFTEETAEFKILLDTLNVVRKLKSEHSLSLKTECKQLILYVKNTKLLESDTTAVALLLGATKCKALVLATESSFENALIATGETEFVAKVNLNGEVNIA